MFKNSALNNDKKKKMSLKFKNGKNFSHLGFKRPRVQSPSVPSPSVQPSRVQVSSSPESKRPDSRHAESKRPSIQSPSAKLSRDHVHTKHPVSSFPGMFISNALQLMYYGSVERAANGYYNSNLSRLLL